MPRFEDLKDLHDRVLPKMQVFEKIMQEFTVEHKSMKDTI